MEARPGFLNPFFAKFKSYYIKKWKRFCNWVRYNIASLLDFSKKWPRNIEYDFPVCAGSEFSEVPKDIPSSHMNQHWDVMSDTITAGSLLYHSNLRIKLIQMVTFPLIL